MPKNSMGYAKRRRKNIHAKRHERKNMHAKEHEEKKKKEINKDSPYFQIKAFIPKREIHDSKEYKKYLELGQYGKFHTLARLDQSV